jgi:Putative zinc-finger
VTGAGPEALSCQEVQELAGELGLGVLVGAERAAVLAHLQNCESCRVVVEDMAELGDSLLLLAPLHEPPAGFESRVLERRVHERGQGGMAPRRHRRVFVAMGAVAAAMVAVAGVSIGLLVTGGSGFKVEHPAAIRAVGGRALAVAVLSGHAGPVGQAFLYSGAPSWLFMTVDADQVHGRVSCEVQTTDGSTVVLGNFEVDSAYRAWGATISVPPRQVRTVVLLDVQGQQVASGTF